MSDFTNLLTGADIHMSVYMKIHTSSLIVLRQSCVPLHSMVSL